MSQTKLLTAEDLHALGDDCHAELVEGRLVPLYGEEGAPMSPASPEHGAVAMVAGSRITVFVQAHRLGHTFAAETGFRLRRNPDTVRAPDFSFVVRGRITPEMNLSRYFGLAPALVLETVSPGDRPGQIARKVREYLHAGVRLVLVAYPGSTVIVTHHPDGTSRTLNADDELLGGDVLPGFVCRVGDLFPKLSDQ